MAQNLFKMFSNDPVEYNMKHLKSQLGMLLIVQLRANGWQNDYAAEVMAVDVKDVEKLLEGKLEDFWVDALFTMLIRLGYSLDASFTPQTEQRPFSLFVMPDN